MDEWRVTLDEDDENAPEVGLPADDYAEWLNHTIGGAWFRDEETGRLMCIPDD